MAEIVAITRTRASRATGPDRLTVSLFVLATFLVVLALLASQIRAAPGVRARPSILVRRIYETRVLETLVGSHGRGSSVTRSQSSAAASVPLATAAPTTRTS